MNTCGVRASHFTGCRAALAGVLLLGLVPDAG